MPNICSQYAETLGKYFREKVRTSNLAETFDISQKTTTQQGIRLTPEIKAKIRGESPNIETSGKMFGSFGTLPFMIQNYQKEKEDGKGGPGLSSQYPTISSVLQPASMGTYSVPGVASAKFDSYANVMSAIKNRSNVFSVLPEEEEEENRFISSYDPQKTMTITPSVIQPEEKESIVEKIKNIPRTLAEFKKPEKRIELGRSVSESPVGKVINFFSAYQPLEEIYPKEKDEILKLKKNLKPYFETGITKTDWSKFKTTYTDDFLKDKKAQKSWERILEIDPTAFISPTRKDIISHDPMSLMPVGGIKALGPKVGRIIKEAAERGLSQKTIQKIAQTPEKAFEPLKQIIKESTEELGKYSKLAEIVKEKSPKIKQKAEQSLREPSEEMNLRYHNLTDAEKKDLNKMLSNAKKEGRIVLDRDMPRKTEELLQVAEHADILKGTISREKATEMDAALIRTKQHGDALYRKLKTGTIIGEEAKAMQREMFDTFKIIIDTGTHQARALQANKAYISPELYDLKTRIINRLNKLNFNLDEVLKEAENVNWDSVDDISRFYSKFIKPKFLDYVDEYRYINLLSSPKAHIINFLTNMLQATAISPLTRLATGVVDAIWSTLSQRERKVYATEVVPYAKGLMNSIGDAASSAYRVLKGSIPVERPDLPSMKTVFDLEENAHIGPAFPNLLQNIKGKTGKAVRAPIQAVQTIPRALEAGDIFFRTLIKRGEMEALAYRYKMNGIEITPQIMQKIEQEAEEKAAYYIFRKALDPYNKTGQGYLLSGIDHISNVLYSIRKNITYNVPGTNKTITVPNPIGWFIPFIQTPMNILKQGIEYSPVGILNIPGSANKQEQIAKMLIGSSVTVGAGWAAASGNLTWESPKGEKERQAFYDSGRKPYSIRIGDNWISYSKLGPIAYPIAMAAAFNWYWKENPKASSESYEKRATQILQGMAGFFSDQSYVQGMGNIIDALQGDEYAIQEITTNIPSQIIPLVSLQRWIAQIIDPVYRKPETEFSYQSIIENLKTGIPLLSKEVPAHKTLTGEESKRNPLNIVIPLDIGKVNTDAERVLQTIRQTQDIKAKSSKAKEAFDKKVEETYGKVLSGELKFMDIVKTDIDLARAVSDFGEEKSYESAEGEAIKSLGVKNGDRAKFIYRKYKEAKTNEQKSALLRDYVQRKILTKEVNKQLQILLNQ